MQTSNLIIGAVAVVFMGFYISSVFIGEDALINRSQVTQDGKGGYTVNTRLLDGSQIIETYEVDDQGRPYSHTLATRAAEPGSELSVIKQGKFVPKHK